MNFHPLANIFPLIEGQAFDDLCADIRTHGVREPVWLYEGLILDGRNRWRAANAVGAECITRNYVGDDPTAFVVSVNLHRRHLTESQRGMAAARLENIGYGGARRSVQDANLHLDQISRSDAAELLNVSTRTVATAAKVIDEAPEEIIKAVDRGAVSVSLASHVVSLPEDEKDDAIQRALENPANTAQVLREAVKAHVANNSGNNEWYTPPLYVNAARDVMGSIDVDPASCAIANKTVQATTYYDEQADGLSQRWDGNVWMNPPYAQPLIAQFCSALVEKFKAGEVKQACVLVNNGTETGWFQSLLECASAACLVKSRIRFIDKEGNPSGAPLQGQAVLYMGAKTSAFADEFSTFGKVLYA